MLSVTSGPEPRKISANPVARVVGPDVVSTCVSTSRPHTEIANPTPITYAGRKRRARIGDTANDNAFAKTAGNIHRPARNGERSSTSSRSWVMNSMIAPISSVPDTMPPRAVPKDRLANNRRSRSGCSRRRCRRPKSTAKASPITTPATGSGCQPFLVSSLSP
ncbi:hypothetical protein ABIA38_002740 [Embleya sp. AB8]